MNVLPLSFGFDCVEIFVTEMLDGVALATGGTAGLATIGIGALATDEFDVLATIGVVNILGVDEFDSLIDEGPGVARFAAFAVFTVGVDDKLTAGLRESLTSLLLPASVAIALILLNNLSTLSVVLFCLVASMFGGCFVVSGEFRIALFRLITFLITSCGSCGVRLFNALLILLPLTFVDDDTFPSMVLLAFESTGFAGVWFVELVFEVDALFDGFVITLVGMLE